MSILNERNCSFLNPESVDIKEYKQSKYLAINVNSDLICDSFLLSPNEIIIFGSTSLIQEVLIKLMKNV